MDIKSEVLCFDSLDNRDYHDKMGKEEFRTRITIESNLDYSDMTDQLFAHDLVLHLFLSIHNAIFEVKYEKYLFP